jgi:hypothetical protein
MRDAHLRAIFQGILLVAATTGGLPCYSCPEIPESTELVSADKLDPDSLPSDSWAFVDDAGVLQVAEGHVVPLELNGQCNALCPQPPIATLRSCELQPGDGGAALACTSGRHEGECGGGRRTQGVRLGRVRAATPAGVYLGACAALEAASVQSFRRLRRELRALGAPRALLRACSRAARDESRHARVLGALARREGGEVGPSEAAPLIARSIEEQATENAVEGCVFETFGALLAQWQAAHTVDLSVRASLARLARDETRHAALAWTMAAWLEARLTPEARQRVREARARAREELLARLSLAPARALRERGLLPGVGEARALAEGLSAALAA